MSKKYIDIVKLYHGFSVKIIKSFLNRLNLKEFKGTSYYGVGVNTSTVNKTGRISKLKVIEILEAINKNKG